MNCVTIREKYQWLEDKTSDEIKKWFDGEVDDTEQFPDLQEFFDDLDSSTIHFIRSLTKEEQSYAKELKIIFDQFLEKYGVSPLVYPRSIRKHIFSLKNEWKKLQNFFDWEAKKDMTSTAVNALHNNEIIKRSSQVELGIVANDSMLKFVTDDSLLKYEKNDVYFAVSNDTIIPFEYENLSSVTRLYVDDDSYTKSTKSISPLIDFRQRLPNFWNNVAPYSVVTNFRCLLNLAKQVCSGCFRDEWKMEIRCVEGIYFLQESSRPLKKVIEDSIRENNALMGSMGRITIKGNRSQTKRSPFQFTPEVILRGDEPETDGDDGEDNDHFFHNTFKGHQQHALEKLVTEKFNEQKLNSKKLEMAVQQPKKNFYRYCMIHRIEAGNKYPVCFTTEVDFDEKELSILAKSGQRVPVSSNIMPIKNISALNLSEKLIYKTALECHFADIKKIRIDVFGYDVDISYDDFKTYSEHSITSAVQEINKQMEAIIKTYQKCNQKDIKMEILKKDSCNLLKYNFCLDNNDA